MNEIVCFIQNNTIINEREFLVVSDVETKEEFTIPLAQINRFEELKYGETAEFYKEYNKDLDKNFLSLVHPDYKIGSEHDFEIIEKVNQYNNSYFLVNSIYNPPLRVSALNWQSNLKKVKCKVVGYKKGAPVLRNIDPNHPKYKVGELYKFNVKGFGTFLDKRNSLNYSVIIEQDNGVKLQVRAYEWHKENLWKYKKIICEVVGFSINGNLKLKIADNRHPIYTINNTYHFEIVKFQDKISMSGLKYKVIKLKDGFDCYYEVLALSNQENTLNIGTKIECKIQEISTRLKLTQVNNDDPYFYEFDDIIKEKSLKSKYFTSIFNTHDNEQIEKMLSQYSSKSAFWVFTYCKHILPNLFYDCIEGRNYSDAIEINDLIIKIENWILSSGIITALSFEKERKMVKQKAESVLKNKIAIKDILIKLNEINYDEIYKELRENISIKKLYYFLSFSDIKLLDTFQFINIIKSIDETILIDEDYFILRKLADRLGIQKRFFISEINEDYFILSKTISDEYKKDLRLYSLWSFCQYLLYGLLKENKKRNLVAAKLLRFQVHSTSKFEDKSTLLFNAFYILTNSSLDNKIPFKEIDDKVIIDIDKLSKNPNIQNMDQKIWIETIKSVEKNQYADVAIIERYYKGFKIDYVGIPGYLPIQNINDKKLRLHNFGEIDWITSVDIHLFCKDFNFFVAKQLEIDNPNYKSKNRKENKLPHLDTIILGKVKAITDIGVFISSIYGDGLLHNNDIDDDIWSKNELEMIFKHDMEIIVIVKSVSKAKRKFSVGFKQLIGTEYEEYYYDFLADSESIEIDGQYKETINSSDEIESQFEEEKGFVFEQFAVIQNELNNKLKYIKFAKQYFANTANNRSYLLNIYIEYFQSLEILDNVIDNYTFRNYEDFKLKINTIKTRLQPQTLESFSESENLIFYINILSLFNETTNESNSTLLEYIEKYSFDQSKHLLQVLAKTTLANNLLISVAQGSKDIEEMDFSLKNLRRIREYIRNGIFTLAESAEDKMEREINEKVKYWREKIKLDEGESLEFKSTLLTPVPDEEKLKIVSKLELELTKSDVLSMKEGIKNKIDEINGLTAQKRIIHSAFKNIAAFANTNGGYLLIGVSDNKEIYGLEKDYASFRHIQDKNRDGFGKLFDSKLKDYFGISFSSLQLKKEFLKFPEGDILIIEVKPSVEEVFILKDKYGNPTEDLYIRNLSSAEKLQGKELTKFARENLRKQIKQ